MRLAVLLVLGGCGFQLTGGAPTDAPGELGDASLEAPPPGTWLAGFDYRKRITFTSGTTTLPDFVAAVALTSDPDLAAHARADGRDFVFTGQDQVTHLDFELETYDGATGAIAAWVRIPSFAPTSEVYLYYGGGTVDDQNAAGTWPAARYGAVWHLTDSQANQARDSTPNSLVLTAPAANNAPAVQPDGLVGAARRYDGIDDSLQRDGNTSAPLTHGSNPYSYGAWVFVTSSQTGFDVVFYKGAGSSIDPGYDIELGSATWATWICDGSGNIVSGSFGQDTLLMNKWVHLVAVVDRATQRFRIYTNGVEVAATLISSVGSTTSAMTVALGRPSYPLAGLIDEMRVYKTALSPQWIGAEYRNLAPATRAAFRAVDPEELSPL